MAQKTIPSKLAVAGVRADAVKPLAAKVGEAELTTHLDFQYFQTALGEKARDMEEEGERPKEPRKTAERVLLAERLKETGVESGVAARRAKFGEKTPEEKRRTEKKTEEKKTLGEEKKTLVADGTTSKAKCEDRQGFLKFATQLKFRMKIAKIIGISLPYISSLFSWFIIYFV